MAGVGFTGTRQGMDDKQIDILTRLLRQTFKLWHEDFLKSNGPKLYETNKEGLCEFRHGDCVGADYEAATIARHLGYRIIGYPPKEKSKRGFFPCHQLHSPEEYLIRNRYIVEFSTFMIACPKEQIEQVRSGTWTTVRYAQKMKKQCLIIYPDGEVSEQVGWSPQQQKLRSFLV